jgi:hypothetical protein
MRKDVLLWLCFMFVAGPSTLAARQDAGDGMRRLWRWAEPARPPTFAEQLEDGAKNPAIGYVCGQHATVLAARVKLEASLEFLSRPRPSRPPFWGAPRWNEPDIEYQSKRFDP